MKTIFSKLSALLYLALIWQACPLMGAVQTAVVLHEFINPSNTNAEFPSHGALVQTPDGTFYGTTAYDGAYQDGTIFKMTPSGTVTVIVQIDNTNTAADPVGGLTLASDGYLYGLALGGGNGLNQYGTVFRVSTNGNPVTVAWFDYTNTGSPPIGGLVQGTDGVLYGATTADGTAGGGTIFSCTTNGLLKAIYHFGTDSNSVYSHGASPTGVIFGPGGLLYGTTEEGSDPSLPAPAPEMGHGTALKITTGGNLTTLAYFDSPHATTNGGFPVGSLVLASDGNFYGLTSQGGTSYNYGTVFKLTQGGDLSYISIFNFTNGASPSLGAGLVQGSNGLLYGTTPFGGTLGDGNVFEVTTNGVLTSLVTFGAFGVTNGATNLAGLNPEAPLMFGGDGFLYGTTCDNFTTDGLGTVYRIGAPPVITLQAISMAGDGFQYGVNGENTNGSVVIIVSTNLTTANWTPILTNPPASGPLQFVDHAATNIARRFYRAFQE